MCSSDLSTTTTTSQATGRGHHNYQEEPGTEKKATLEPEGGTFCRESSTQTSNESDSISTLRKRNSSGFLNRMGDDASENSLVALDGDIWSKMVNNKSNEGNSSQSNTSATFSDSDSGESNGKKSRSNSPQRARTYMKSDSSSSLSSNENTSESLYSPLLLTAIRKADTKSTLYRSPSLPLLILPSPDCGNDMDPDEFLIQLITALYPKVHLKVKSALKLESYFPTISEAQMATYNNEIVQLARMNDVTALQEYYQKHGRDSMNCYNRFGEGLLNMACRRGFTEMVQFLLSPNVYLPVRVRDDGGRTPLHDACWYPEPQLDVCTMIIQRDPSLLLVADKRGYTPFQYARKSDWLIWRKFLVQHLDQLRILGTNPDIVARFS